MSPVAVDRTVATLTWHSLVGRRRSVLLMILPAVLLVLAVVLRLAQGQDVGASVTLLGGFALGTVVPLLGLIAGTGAIGPEIDDGSIVYLLAKPLNRFSIVLSKLLVVVALVAIFGALPTLVAGLVMSGGSGGVAVGYAVGVLVAGTAYSALFLLLGVLTRNAVVVGLLYALVWESVVGGFVPGAQALSVQQWALAVTEKVVGSSAADLGIASAVGFGTGVVLLVTVTVGAAVYAGWRLRSIHLSTDE
jgi:ABC-2 type transport system permease protein